MDEKNKKTVGRPITGEEKMARMQFHAGASQRKRWQEAAGGNLSLWIRQTLDVAAAKVVGKNGKK